MRRLIDAGLVHERVPAPSWRPGCGSRRSPRCDAAGTPRRCALASLSARLEDRLGHSPHQRQIAANARLHVHRPGRGGVHGGHGARSSCGTMVRPDAASMSGFTCTISAPRRCAFAREVSIRGAFEAALTAITIRRSALSQSSSVARALAGSQRRRQCASARLVAHVRAVREVVRPELARPQLVEERGLVAQTAGGVERRLIRAVERSQRASRPVRTRPPTRSARSVSESAS